MPISHHANNKVYQKQVQAIIKIFTKFIHSKNLPAT